MCGISAWFDLQNRKRNEGTEGYQQQRAKLTAQLDDSVESMRHRGPNAKGIWVSPDSDTGLGHVRLSTRDLSSAGHQPLHSPDETDDIHVVVNGELYYDPSLRVNLEKEYDFQSTSDSEMAIALYRRYGAEFVQHLRGEFSLVLYDGKKQALVAARDRFGVKPLHWGVFDGKLLIATQCKGIAKLLPNDQPMQWSAQCLAQGGGHYGYKTLFNGFNKFPQGNILIVHRGQTGDLQFTPYFESKFSANQNGDDDRPADELIEQLRKHLFEAVRIRLESSDVEVGILLSGGVDSSAVAGMSAEVSRRRRAMNSAAPALPTCFTIAFPDDDDLDESAVATRTAEHLGLPIDKVVVTEQMLADEFDEACWRGEALMWDLQYVSFKIPPRY